MTILTYADSSAERKVALAMGSVVDPSMRKWLRAGSPWMVAADEEEETTEDEEEDGCELETELLLESDDELELAEEVSLPCSARR